MKRKYNLDVYSGRVERIKKLMPFACIAADVITGFPWESDSDFGVTPSIISISFPFRTCMYSLIRKGQIPGLPGSVPLFLKQLKRTEAEHFITCRMREKSGFLSSKQGQGSECPF